MTIQKVFSDHQATRSAGYWNQPIPSPLDHELDQIFAKTKVSELRQQVIALSKVDWTFSRLIAAFAVRIATLAVRRNSLGFAKDGLKAVLAIQAIVDIRDDLVTMAIVYDSLKRCGADPAQVFRRLEEESPPECIEFMNSFLQRSEDDRS